MQRLKVICRWILRTDKSDRAIGRSLGVSYSTVSRYRKILADQVLDWDDIEALDELELDRRLNPSRHAAKKPFAEPDWSHVHTEYERPGVTLTLLHEEYALEVAETGMSETEFRRRYQRYARTRGLIMRQIHYPGQELFLDFSGMRPCVREIISCPRHKTIHCPTLVPAGAPGCLACVPKVTHPRIRPGVPVGSRVDTKYF